MAGRRKMAAEEKTQGEGGGDETNEERMEIRQGETRGRGGARTLKDKYACTIREVGDELLSLCRGSLGVSAAGGRLQVDSSPPFFLSSIPPPLLAVPHRSSLPWQHGRAEPSKRGMRRGKTKKWERGKSGGIHSSVTLIQEGAGVPPLVATIPKM